MKILDVPRSGSYQGITSSRNRYGQYVRTRAMPIQPRTDAQLFVRSALAALASGWRALTEAQRLAWNAYAGTVSRTDSLGQTVFQTGAQAYVGTGLNAVYAGKPETDVPPAGVPPDPIAEFVLLLDLSSGFKATVVADPTVTNPFLVFASPPTSAGVTFQGDLRYLETTEGPLTTNILDFTASYEAKYGVAPLGSRIFVKLVGWKNNQVTLGTTVSGLVVA